MHDISAESIKVATKFNNANNIGEDFVNNVTALNMFKRLRTL